MPTVSVIVPIYNTESYLRRCVDSLLAQTYRDFEVILVDDGSTDACGEICDEYAVKDKRVRVFHQTNQGQAVARNHALDWLFANSDSRYISFVDSDDWVHPSFLEYLYNGLKQNDADICQCKHIRVNDSAAVQEVEANYYCVTPAEEYIEHYSPHMWEKLYTRRIWERFRFPEGQIYEDLAIWYKILFSQTQIVMVDAPLYFYFLNPQGTMRQDWHPGMLARMDAWDDQVAFFNKYGDESLLKNAVGRYLQIAYIEFDAIDRSKRLSEKEKKKNQTILRKKLRRILLSNTKEARANHLFRWALETAHPKTTWFYWTARGVLGKFKKRE